MSVTCETYECLGDSNQWGEEVWMQSMNVVNEIGNIKGDKVCGRYESKYVIYIIIIVTDI